MESFELYDSRDNAKEFDDNQRNFQFCFNGLQNDIPIYFYTRKVYKSYYINIIIKQQFLFETKREDWLCVCDLHLDTDQLFSYCVGGLDE